jgi:ribosomal protein L11 methyltransferase
MSSTIWLEVIMDCPPTESGLLELWLEQLGFRGWVDESTDEITSYRVYLPQELGWEERLHQLESAAQAASGVVRTGEQLQDEDWAENWKKFYHPLEVGNNLVICPSWEKFEAKPKQIVMVLDPGSAFGTGYHWSTRLCLEFVEETVVGRPAERMKVLDWGTGSGILAIAAWLLGVRNIQAIDNDPVAVKVANENFELNGLTVKAELSDKAPASGYDLISANLIASTLIELAPQIVASLRAGGTLIAGGIIDTRKEEVTLALQAAGLKLGDSHLREEWVALKMHLPLR